MKLLLHICCAPCSIWPLSELRAEGLEVTGFFCNRNIHPYQEFRRRLDGVREYAKRAELPMIYDEDYRLEEFLGAVAGDPASRCQYCYASRLEETARVAGALGFPAFSAALLYSRYQQHDLIRQLGEEAACRHGLQFVYRDFRPGWQAGIRESKELGLYRQQYCGCIYSEKERYCPSQRRGGG